MHVVERAGAGDADVRMGRVIGLGVLGNAGKSMGSLGDCGIVQVCTHIMLIIALGGLKDEYIVKTLSEEYIAEWRVI